MAGAGPQRDPQPLDRQAEVAFVTLAGLLLVLVWAAVAGVGVSAALFGGGWVWPDSNSQSAQVAASLLSGHPGRGLSPGQAQRLPGPALIYGCAIAGDLLTLACAGGGALMVTRYRRPGDSRRGMATRYEAAQVLGVRRLRGARPVIRPDLVGLRGWLPHIGRDLHKNTTSTSTGSERSTR